MEELNQIVQRKLQAMADDGSIAALIEKSVENMVASAIEEQFRSYGSLSKQIKEGIEGSLVINFDNLDMASYNQIMLRAVKNKLDSFCSKEINGLLQKQIESVFGTPPKTMAIEELLDKIVEFIKNKDSDGDVTDVSVSYTHRTTYGDWYELTVNIEYSYLVKEETIAKIHFSLIDEESKSSGSSPILINHSHDVHFNPTAGSNLKETIAAYIFNLYAAKTVITGLREFDADDYYVDLDEYD